MKRYLAGVGGEWGMRVRHRESGDRWWGRQ